MTKRVHTPAKLSRRRNENWPPLSCRRGKWMLRRSWLACEPGVRQGRRARDVRKALRAPGAPGRPRRSQLRPGLRKPPSPTAPTGLRPPQVPFRARHSPARDGSAPRASRAPLTREMARGCSKSLPPTRRKPQGPGPCRTICRVVMARRRRVATQGDRRGRTRSGELGSLAAVGERARGAVRWSLRRAGARQEEGGGGSSQAASRPPAPPVLPPAVRSTRPGQRVWPESRGSAQGLGI